MSFSRPDPHLSLDSSKIVGSEGTLCCPCIDGVEDFARGLSVSELGAMLSCVWGDSFYPVSDVLTHVGPCPVPVEIKFL